MVMVPDGVIPSNEFVICTFATIVIGQIYVFFIFLYVVFDLNKISLLIPLPIEGRVWEGTYFTTYFFLTSSLFCAIT